MRQFKSANLNPDHIYVAKPGGRISQTFYYGNGKFITEKYPRTHDEMLVLRKDVFDICFPQIKKLVTTKEAAGLAEFIVAGDENLLRELPDDSQFKTDGKLNIKKVITFLDEHDVGRRMANYQALAGRFGPMKSSEIFSDQPESEFSIVIAFWNAKFGQMLGQNVELMQKFLNDKKVAEKIFNQYNKKIGTKDWIVAPRTQSPIEYEKLSSIRLEAVEGAEVPDLKEPVDTKKYKINGSFYKYDEIIQMVGAMHSLPKQSNEYKKIKSILCSEDMNQNPKLRKLIPPLCTQEPTMPQRTAARLKQLYSPGKDTALLHPLGRPTSEGFSFIEFLNNNP